MTQPNSATSQRLLGGFASWLRSYLMQNPIKAIGTAALTFGTLLLIPVFWAIGELPQLDVPSMLPLVGTIAAGGLIIMLALVAMPAAGGWLARSKPGAPAWQSDWWTVLIYVIPGIVIALCLWIAILFEIGGGIVRYTLFLVLMGPVLAAIRMRVLSPSLSDRTAVVVGWSTLAWNSIVLTVLTSYLIITSVEIVVAEALSVHAVGLAIAVWTLYASMVTTIAIRFTTRELLPFLLGAAFFVAFGLLVGTGGLTSISKAMLRKASWGDYPAKLFVSDRGCDILNRSAGKAVCRKDTAGGANLVCPVVVRSRIGTPYFLSFTAFTSSGAWPDREAVWNVSLPKEDVVVSQRIEALKSARGKSEEPPGSLSPATYLTLGNGEHGRWITDQCGAAVADGAK